MVAFFFGVAQTAEAQRSLRCGDSAAGFLQLNGEDVFTFIPERPGSVLFLQVSATSGNLNGVRLRITGGGINEDSCRSVFEIPTPAAPLTIRVSPCLGGSGAYRLNADIVSGGDANCGAPLGCAATTDDVGLSELGEVDSFQFPGVAGARVRLRINDLGRDGDEYLVRAFNPRGQAILDVCGGENFTLTTSVTGVYTVLVSACGSLSDGRYRLARIDPMCPSGPTITTFSLLPDDLEFVLPRGFDAAGRPIYMASGTLNWLLVEGRAGASLELVGLNSVQDLGSPDLQMIVSRPLGQGNPVICDQFEADPTMSGVPATVPFSFSGDAATPQRLNDLGCRFDEDLDGPAGQIDPIDSCVRLPSLALDFADPASEVQFCGRVTTRNDGFPPGDTIVAARLRDRAGNLGEKREIVVRVEGPPPTSTRTRTPRPTATHTRMRATATRTRTRTRTPPPTIRPSGPCTGDCNRDGRVRVAELTRCVLIALGRRSLADCRGADADGDGVVMIGELIEAVNNALIGCPPPE